MINDKENIMKQVVLTLIFAAFFLCLFGQAPDWAWAKRAGGTNNDYGQSIVTDGNGNCYITGYFAGSATFGTTTLTSSGSSDVYVAKQNAAGDWIWAVKGGGASDDRGFSIALDADDNIYITGYFTGTATFGSTTLTSFGGQDILIAKLSSSGSWLWAVKAGGTSIDYGTSIAVDSSGTSYVTGVFFKCWHLWHYQSYQQWDL